MGRVKQTNTKRDPRVAVAIFDQTNPYNMVTIKGKVVDQLKGSSAEQHIDKMAKKYTGQERYPNRKPAEQRVLLKIEPERIAGMGRSEDQDNPSNARRSLRARNPQPSQSFALA